MTKDTPKEERIKKICAWCNLIMQDGSEPASHGICPQCGKKVMESYEKSSGFFGSWSIQTSPGCSTLIWTGEDELIQ